MKRVEIQECLNTSSMIEFRRLDLSKVLHVNEVAIIGGKFRLVVDGKEVWRSWSE